MKAFLIFLSSLFAVISFTAKADEVDSQEYVSQLERYTFQIENSNSVVSGILITSENNGDIRGSMINEFGVSALDFIYTKKNEKIKILNVISFLNKWYIKRVLRNDIKYCLHILYGIPLKGKSNYEVVKSVEQTSIINNKWHLKYTLTPLMILEDEIEE